MCAQQFEYLQLLVVLPRAALQGSYREGKELQDVLGCRRAALLAVGKVGMQNSICPIRTFPETVLCDISTTPSPRSPVVLLYAQELNEALRLLKGNIYHGTVRVLFLWKGLGFVCVFLFLPLI